jgi:signal transduction histidine kinase/FixJ family two-component response regulator
MVTHFPQSRFYAGVPIISPKGITIGSYCIIDDEPRPGLDAPSVKFLQHMASTVMAHLDMARCKAEQRRAERMIVGLGSFVEGKATLRNEWVHDTNICLNEQESGEGHINTMQQDAQSRSKLVQHGYARPSAKPLQSQIFPREESEQSTSSGLISVPPAGLFSNPSSSPSTTFSGKSSDASVEQTSSFNNKAETETSFSTRSSASTENLQEDMLSTGVRQLFSRAANIIRESIEVEGVAFFDASIGSYGGLVSDTKRKGPGTDSGSWEGSAGSSDDSTGSDSQGSFTASAGKEIIPENPTVCGLLGFSTSATSSINDESRGALALREELLEALLRRYPRGKIFNFNELGSLSSDESSDGPQKNALEVDGPDPTTTNITCERGRGRGRKPRKKTRSAMLKEDGDVLSQIFAGARSIALLPMWDSHRARWFSGALIWTNTPRRVFTSGTELTYLSAFGNSIMAEVHRLDIEMSEKAKTTLVSSISHELRSPLHGILGTSEILRDTAMNALQHGLVHTIESCGRTLLDTINHLLDFSKINNFRKGEGDQAIHKRKRPPRRHNNTDLSPQSSKPTRRTRHGGMINLKSDVQLDAVLEEVLESVFAGYSFYYSPPKSIAVNRPASMSLDVLDNFQQTGQISIILDIDETIEWKFFTQIGAWRRVMMNIFGNALKYTKTGYIFVKLTASPVTPAEVPATRQPSKSKVTLTVKDTGQGISMEYLQNGLFTPFTQEDSMAPGNGLGLSIVRQAVLSMGGYIEVSSLRGRGTEVTIGVTLPHVPSPSANSDQPEPEPIVKVRNFTRGARVGLLGLGSPDISERDTILCTHLERLCRDWFEMDVHVVSPSDESPPLCGFYIAVQTDTEPVNTWDVWLSKAKNGHIHDDDKSHVISMVVICQSPEAAHFMFVAATESDQSNHEAIVEFISQPCGPRKLAKAFSMCIKRQQSRRSLTGSNASTDQAQQKNMPRSTETRPVSREGIEAQRTEVETQFGIDTAAKKAIDDEYCDLDKVNVSQQSVDIDLPQTDSDDKTLPIREKRAKLEKETATMTVLLVEDNDVNLQILIAYMKKEGYQYATARNGLEALNIFKASPGRFGVVVMDVSMPLMNGFESARRIRSSEREYQNTLEVSERESFRPATIIALTGLASASAQNEAYGSGMDLFLAKPIRREQLLAVLRERSAGEDNKASR